MRTFDELYFISDLHLGGAPGCQVFNQGAKLAAFIRYIAERDPGRHVVLVLGGDIIDFLAFDAPYLKPGDQALRLLEQVLADSEFKQIFEALAGFLRRAEKESASQLPGSYGWKMFFGSAGGVVVLAGFFSLIGGRRKRRSVNQEIYDRQIKSE